ncbi:MAG: glycyl-radical enzyme activating protein [Kiritimatiellia bacterium]|jgi:glycyl-radical enzyme activating protein
MGKKGRIFSIQKFSVNDGPGIRTTVFLKGCPLRCIWCHNPESQSPRRELAFNSDRCAGCRRCEALCPNGCHVFSVEDGVAVHRFDRTRCIACGCCLNVMCNALSMFGEERGAESIIADVLRDKPFYDATGGGLTISGGEPFAQLPFLMELLRQAKTAGMHTCVETSGFTQQESIAEALPLVDLFLFDWKETDPTLHRKWTGEGNEGILSNLRFMDASGGRIVLRCPIIPGCNDRDDHFEGIARLAESLENIMEVNVEPFNSLAAGKFAQLGRTSAFENVTKPDQPTKDAWLRRIRSLTSKKVVEA